MNAIQFQNTLEFDLGIEFDNRINHLAGSQAFFNALILGLKTKIRNDHFIKLTNKKYQNFIDFKNKEILADGKNYVLYRIAGKIYINRKKNNGWETARIF